MNYSLLPFPTFSRDPGYAGRPDIRHALKTRAEAGKAKGIRNLDLLDHTVECLRALPWRFYVDHCHEQNGRLHLAVIATDLGRNLTLDDEVNAGFFVQNSEAGDCETIACTRIFRVACRNGALVECERGQSFRISSSKSPPADWPDRLGRVMARSFDGDGVDADTARFHATTQQMIVTPYELLCHLSAQQLIDDDEQSSIQAAFDEAADFTMYGFINAVTQCAHELRANDRWTRAVHIEQLGGEILRGDHQLPSFQPAYS